MTDNTGIKMRIIALDELMKCCAEIGRTTDDPVYREFAKRLYEVARTRHGFLSASRQDTEKDKE
jgi:hypothetical protein